MKGFKKFINEVKLKEEILDDFRDWVFDILELSVNGDLKVNDLRKYIKDNFNDFLKEYKYNVSWSNEFASTIEEVIADSDEYFENK